MSITGVDLTGKVVLVRKSAVAPEYQNGELRFMCESGNGCHPESIGTKVFGYFLDAPHTDAYIRRSHVQEVLDPQPALTKKATVEAQEKTPLAKDYAEQVKLAETVDVRLWSDMARHSNGSMHMGFNLATYKHDGYDGAVVAGGNEITVTVAGRTWGVPLQTIVELAIQADKQREVKLAAS